MRFERTINSTKNFLKSSLLTGLLTIIPLTVKPCSGYNVENVDFLAEFGIKHEPRLITHVNNIPENIRQISDNNWFNYGTITIKDNSAYLRDRLAIGGRLGTRLHFEEGGRMLFGLGLDFVLNEKQVDAKEIKYKDLKKSSKNNTQNSKSLCEGTPSIDGVYWSLNNAYLFKNNKYLRPFIYGEINTKLSERSRIGFGIQAWHEKIIVENGYTKGSVLDKKSRHNLVDMLNGNLYVSLKFLEDEFEENKTIYSLDFGVSGILSKKISDLAKDIEFEYNNPTWYVGLKAGTGL